MRTCIFCRKDPFALHTNEARSDVYKLCMRYAPSGRVRRSQQDVIAGSVYSVGNEYREYVVSSPTVDETKEYAYQWGYTTLNKKIKGLHA